MASARPWRTSRTIPASRCSYALSQSELCVCDVAAVVGATTAAASYHLRLLYRTGLVDYRRDGRLVYYRLAEDRMRPVLEAIKSYVLAMQAP